MAAQNDPATAIAGMAKVGNPRVPMGDAAFNSPVTYTGSKNTKLVAKTNTAAGDNAGPTGSRKGVIYPKPAGKGDRNGAAYRVSVALPGPVDPNAGNTQANGRIIRPAINRSSPNFSDGTQAGA